jgi:nicotinamide-nucleotide amidase
MTEEAPAARVLAAAGQRGWTVGVAESLTGGLVVAELVAVPGASAVVRGGVVAYATDLKATLLGVSGELLDAVGAVDPDVAQQMARGVCQALGAQVGIATTGVAGPDGQDGKPPGLVYVAVTTPQAQSVHELHLVGGRAAVRAAAVRAALDLALELLDPAR